MKAELYLPTCEIDWRANTGISGVYTVGYDGDVDIYAILAAWQNKNYVVYAFSTAPVISEAYHPTDEHHIGWGVGTWRKIYFLYRSDEVYRTREEAAAVSDVPASAVYVYDEHYWHLQDGRYEKCCSGFYRTYSSITALVQAWKRLSIEGIT